MGIQSTQYIIRERAIKRIRFIDSCVNYEDYRGLEEEAYGPDNSVRDFIQGVRVNGAIEQWTNTMLADKMDEPFYRYSMFDNYIIQEG